MEKDFTDVEKLNNQLDPSLEEAPFSVMNALNVIQTPTNHAWIKEKSIGGKSLSYVSQDLVIRLLNKAFSYRWSFYILETRYVQSQDYVKKDWKTKEAVTHEQGAVIQVHGRLVVPGWGAREQWGAQVLTGGSDVQEHAFKGATSDAMKKCASMFGVTLDIYGKEDPQTLESLSVTAMDLLIDDERVLENFKTSMKKKAEEKRMKAENPNPPEEAPEEAVTQPAQPNPSQEVNKDFQVKQEETPQTASTENEQPEATPVDAVQNQPHPQVDETHPVQQETNSGSYFDPADIQKVKDWKNKLGLESNDGLDVFVQEFFGNPEMTFRHLTPMNIKDFIHYLDGRL